MKIFPFLCKSLPRWLVLSVILLGNMFTAQTARAAVSPCSQTSLHQGPITADETWCSGGDNTHYLSNDVTVQAGVTLTIAPGVTVDSTVDAWSKYLIVQGHLDINGTPTQPVLLTRSYNYPNQNWSGLYFDGSQGDGSGTINYAIIDHAGSNFLPTGCTGTCGNGQTAVFVKDLGVGKQVTISNSIIHDNVSKGLYVVDSTVNVTNTTFSQNKYPILIDGAASVVTYSGNTFSDNAYPYYDNVNYTVQEDAIFINPNALMGHNFNLSPQAGLDAYVMWGHTTIPAGVTMTVEPGVTVRMDGDKYLAVQGHLDVIGTQALPIYFTGIPGSDPAVTHYWGGLYFDGTEGDGSGNLDYASIEHGSSNFSPPGCTGCSTQNAVFAKNLPAGKPLNISHSTIQDNYVRGLYVENSAVNVTNTTFSRNAYPIWIEGADSVISYSGNTFVDNTYGSSVNYPMPLDAIVIGPNALMGQDFSLSAQTGLDFYAFPSDTIIPVGTTMTVDPGVTLRMADNKYLTVQGQLNAIGSQALPIFFDGIPHYDNLNVIDNWGGLFFDGSQGDGSGMLAHAIIERGGSNFLPPSCTGTCGTAQTAVLVKDLPAGKQLNISNSVIEDSLSKGLYVVNSPTAHVDGNLIKGGRIGAYFVSNMTVSNLALIDQALYGVVVESGYSVDARHLTIARAGQIGFYTTGTGLLKNSILSQNTLAVKTEGSGQATLDTNLADANTTFKNGAVMELNTVGGSTAFEADGYHIQTSSDAVGKGMVGLSVAMDIDGDARPSPAGGLPDLGADEVPVGYNTFTDVSDSYWARLFIERLYGAGITGGCSLNPLMYCPETAVTRAQMAVFLLRGIHGSSYSPPAVGVGTGFNDVPADYWSAAWIKQLALEGITSGCGPNLYCPETSVTRDQMAVFLLRAEHGSAYSPPTATGVFTDVPTTHWAAPWIEQLAAEGITGGCGADTYCPSTAVTRAQMAVFLVRAFNLP